MLHPKLRKAMLLVLLLLDVAVLTGISHWILHRKDVSAPTKVATTQPDDAISETGSVSLVNMPHYAEGPTQGGPKFVVCGTVDLSGRVWFGSEGQGVWSMFHGDFRQFGSSQGLADDDACAVASDALGRIWVGHSAHGLSIYNGETWRTYDRFSGLGGSHVFCIATCPVDGDVWLGTEAGLTRYSLSHDSWTTYDRGAGLPSEQASSIAFDSAGNVFVGLQGNGLAMAKAADSYAHWTQVAGIEEMPVTPTGTGLPSWVVNAVLVTHNDVIYVGTSRGLARSVDHGATWSYIRGVNWVQLARGRYYGVPADFSPQEGSPLAEDWITSLAEDSAGALWVAFRSAGYAAFPIKGEGVTHPTKKVLLTTIIPVPGQGCLVGTYGNGILQCGDVFSGPPVLPAVRDVHSALAASAFPSNAPPPTVEALEALRQKIASLPAGKSGIEFIGDDWETLGDWTGHYGNATAHFLGYGSRNDTPGFSVELTTGPYRHAYMRYYWVPGDNSPFKVRGLFDPRKKTRVFCENNDESYDARAHPAFEEGPDLFVKVQVPDGVHRLSLYFHNFDGHQGSLGMREYILDAKGVDSVEKPVAASDQGDDPVINTAVTDSSGGDVEPVASIEPELAPTIVRSYVPRAWCGVYKQFLLRGAGTYWIKLGRNHSPCLKVQGAFIDRLDAPLESSKKSDPEFPLPPKVNDATAAPGALGAAARVWAALDASVGRAGYAELSHHARTEAYRAAAASGADPNLLASWRWSIASWTKADRDQFDKTVGAQ